jgi:hypothetical protein
MLKEEIVVGQLSRSEHVIRRFDKASSRDEKVACERLSLKTPTTRISASLRYEKLKRNAHRCAVEIFRSH